MHLTLEPHSLTVSRLAANEAVPLWASGPGGFLSLTRTSAELSIVCASELVPSTVKQEPGWRAFKVAGPLDFGLTGVLVEILAPLAKARLSVFSISTFDTDYVLVREASVAEAVQVLESAGHTVNQA
jgi:hypothetical protein